MTPERYSIIRRTLDRRQPDLTVITDEVHKGRNLSAMIRTCDAVGVMEFHCVVPAAGFRTFRGTALGTEKWVDVTTHDDIVTGVQQLKSTGHQIIAANLSEKAVEYTSIDYTKPTALLMGNETTGVSDLVLPHVNHEVIIPMMGMAESFNVSVAAAIILTEARRQRQLAGLYEACRLPGDVYHSKLFQWCQPIVTQFCDERGLDYPAINEEGEIMDGPGWYAKIRAAQEIE